MKYRLTVKGQVALATLLILLSFIAGSRLFPENGSRPGNTEVPTIAAQTPPPQTNPSEQKPTESILSAEALEKIAATIYFTPDRWEIQAEEIQKITAITRDLLEHPELRIVVEGNIHRALDSEDSSFGKELSLKRAEVVAQVLMGKGIDASRIDVKSNGGAQPATTDPDESWMNRRTRVYIEGYKGETP